MLNQCFNPDCRKPLHYLREGRVFVFGVQESGDGEHGDGCRLEHYWLCGACALEYALAQDEQGIHMMKRRMRPRAMELEMPEPPQALAS